MDLEEVPVHDCCPNHCPDINKLAEKLRMDRKRIHKKLLKASEEPIDFDKADEKNVLRVISNGNVIAECTNRVVDLLIHVNVAETKAREIAQTMMDEISSASSYEDLLKIGERWHQKFIENNIFDPLLSIMMDRNRWVAGLISAKLLPGITLDHDSGDSYVARFIQEKRPDVKVYTQDAFDFREEVKDLPFELYDYNSKTMPYPDGWECDNMIMATVLHHCDDPETMFDELVKLLKKGGRLILFENVFSTGDLLERDINVFFDWFFNKVFHINGLPLPFSHFCPNEWKEFLIHKGFKILEMDEHLGRWPSIPLEHAIYVAEKE